MDKITIGDAAPDDEPDNVVHLHAGPQDDDQHDDQGDEMSYEEAMAADDPGGEEASPDDASSGDGMASLLEQGVRVSAGFVSAGASALAGALRASMPGASESEDDRAATLAGAGLGAAATVAEATASAAGSAADVLGPLISSLFNPRFAKDADGVVASAARVMDGQWRATQAEAAEAAGAFIGALVPEIVNGLADQVDLTKLVRERVDLNAIVDDVDVDRILARIDIDEIVRRVDMERLAEDFPVDAVLDRVDLDAVVERVDLQAVIDRLDLPEIAQEVVEDIDLPSIIRESSGAMAGETIQAVRMQGINADRFVSRIVDTVLRRRARDGEPPVPDTDTSGSTTP